MNARRREGSEKPRNGLAGYKNRPRHTFTSWHDWGLLRLGAVLSCPLPSPNLHLRYLDMSGASFFAGTHHFVARDNIFIEAQTVSGILTKVSNKQANDVGSVAA